MKLPVCLVYSDSEIDFACAKTIGIATRSDRKKMSFMNEQIIRFDFWFCAQRTPTTKHTEKSVKAMRQSKCGLIACHVRFTVVIQLGSVEVQQ